MRSILVTLGNNNPRAARVSGYRVYQMLTPYSEICFAED